MSDDSSSHSVVNRSGGVDINAQAVNIYGDVVGQNKNEASRGAQSRADSRERYLEQIIRYHCDLDFVGIPEMKDRQALQLEDVFIHLQAEIEIERRPLKVDQRIADELAKAGEAEAVREMEINQLVRSNKATQKLSVNEALAKYDCMVILGDPGAGKTTLLEYVTLAFARRQSDHLGLTEDCLPIFIRLYDYVTKRAERRAAYSLIDYLCEQMHELSTSLDTRFFEDALENGECCVCLDGLDELGGVVLRREVSAVVKALVNKYRRNRYLITSRLVGYEEAPFDKHEFVHCTLLPFSDDDIQAFATRWYVAREKDPTTARERSQNLIDTILREPRIKALAANPLLLTIIALVHHTTNELPHERVKLYDTCVRVMLETWDKDNKGLSTADRPYYQYRRLLGQLAYWMHTHAVNTSTSHEEQVCEVKEQELAIQIRGFLRTSAGRDLDDDLIRAKADNFVRLVTGRSGLLIRRSTNTFSFAHLSFQEYLAATDIERRFEQSIDALWNEIQPRLHDAHWREVILLLLGSLSQREQHSTELVRRIFESTDEYEPVIHRHLFLAARSLSDGVEVDAKLRRAIVDQLMTLATSQELWLSNDAFRTLGTLRGDSYVSNRLLAFLKESRSSGEKQAAAYEALNQLGQSSEVADLLETQDPDSIIALVATLVAMKTNSHQDYSDAIARLITSAHDPEAGVHLQKFVAHLLKYLGEINEAAQMFWALAQNPEADASVQSAAIEEIGKLDRADSDICKRLLALANDDQIDASVQRAALQAIGRIDDVDSNILERLLAFARDSQKNIWTRYQAVRAFKQFGSAEETFQLLLSISQQPEMSTWIRIDAAGDLAQSDYENEALLILFNFAQNYEIDVDERRSALYSISKFRQCDEVVLRGLQSLAQDSQMDEGIRLDAALAFSKFKQSDEVTQLLLALALDPKVEGWTHNDAAQALGKLGKANEAVPILRALAQDLNVDNELRIDAAQALAQLGHIDDAAKILIAFAQDLQMDSSARLDLARAIGELGYTDDAAHILLTVVQDPQVEDWMRNIAYNSLKSLFGVGS